MEARVRERTSELALTRDTLKRKTQLFYDSFDLLENFIGVFKGPCFHQQHLAALIQEQGGGGASDIQGRADLPIGIRHQGERNLCVALNCFRAGP